MDEVTGRTCQTDHPIDVCGHNHGHIDNNNDNGGDSVKSRKTAQTTNQFDCTSLSDGESNKTTDTNETEDPRYPWETKTEANNVDNAPVIDDTTRTEMIRKEIELAGPKSQPSKRRTSPSTTTPKVTAPKMTAPASSVTKQSTIQDSPTTKVLNSFSQNMDDLRCEPCLDNNYSVTNAHTNANGDDVDNTTACVYAKKGLDRSESKSPLISTTTPQSMTSTFDIPDGYDVNWKIHLIHFSSLALEASSPERFDSSCEQGLGVVIVRGTFPTTKLDERQTRRPHCLVKRLHEGGMGSRCGLKPGDWFLRPTINYTAAVSSSQRAGGERSASSGPDNTATTDSYESVGAPKLATFEEIQKWSKESYPDIPPIRVLRKRMRTRMNESVPPSPSTATTIPTSGPKSNVTNSAVASSSSSDRRENCASVSITEKTKCKAVTTTASAHSTIDNASSVSMPVWMTTKRARANQRSIGIAAVTPSVPVTISTAKTAVSPRASEGKPKLSGKSDKDSMDNRNGSYYSDCEIPPPYCVLCNYYNPKHWEENCIFGKNRSKPKRAPRDHHCWCPKRKNFDAARVEKLLNRMKHSYHVLGCQACHMEYQTGKVISIRKNKAKDSSKKTDYVDEGMEHNRACLLYQEKLKEEERRKRKQEDKERKERNEARKRKACKRKMAPRKPHRVVEKNERKKWNRRTNIRDNKKGQAITSAYNSSSSCDVTNSDEDTGCDDGSIYKPPTRRARLEASTYRGNVAKIDSNEEIRISRKKQRTSEKNKDVMPSNMDGRSQQCSGVTPKRKSIRDKNKNDLVGSTVNRDRSETLHEGDDDNERVKMVWVPLHDNPWGEEGYQTGDVLLYGPQRGIGHHETYLPSNHRYRVNSFEVHSTYRTTHRAPEDGVALLCLKRDPLGRMPWGFQPIRDEFGHACLIQSVDPISPASAATFLGVPDANHEPTDVSTGIESGGLRVNDMIVAINGKPVGGMTEAGLELELELSAPHLLLAVSRYRHADKVAKQFAEMERKMLDIMDRAARDDRLMGWREIGNGIESRPLDAGASVLEKAKALPQSKFTKSVLTDGLISRRPIHYDGEIVSPSRKEAFSVEKPGDFSEHKCAKTDNIDDKVFDCNISSRNLRTIATSKDEKESQTNAISHINESPQNAPEAGHDSSSEASEDSAAHDENPQMGW